MKRKVEAGSGPSHPRMIPENVPPRVEPSLYGKTVTWLRPPLGHLPTTQRPFKKVGERSEGVPLFPKQPLELPAQHCSMQLL